MLLAEDMYCIWFFDLTMAADNAVLGQTGAEVGPQKGHEMCFLARFYSASEAEQMGLVNTVVPIEMVENETIKWCREILRNSSTVMLVLKSALIAFDDGHAGLQALAGDATLKFYSTEEGIEGKTAYMERRRPDFSKFPRKS